MAGNDSNDETGASSAGREALARGDWAAARAAFAEAVAQEATPEGFEGLAWAVYWLDDARATFDARHAAYRLYRERGDLAGAARVAIRLAEDHLSFRAEPAAANGWLRRAESLLAELEPCAEHGWLTFFAGHLALLARGDTAEGRRRGEEAATLGRLLGEPDLEVLGTALQGLSLVSAGAVEEGMSRLDEATAAAAGGELANFEAIVWAHCYLVFGCERVRDYARAAQWCDITKDFSQRFALAQAFSVCRTHYASVLVWRGAWEQAEAELGAATSYFAAKRPGLAGEAIVRLGELRLRQGRLAEAADLFAQAEGEPAALAGRAWLALEKGDRVAAVELAERFLRRLPREAMTERVAALELLVRAHSERSELARAREALDELRVIVEAIATEALHASLSEAEGIVEAAAGRHDAARRSFEDAVDLYERTGSSFNAGRTRIKLARSLRVLGRADAATSEARAALASLRALGAEHEAERAVAVLERRARLPGGLTPREVEVLQLVARGLGDREIARQLVVSEHTVHRHVSNILAKLRVSSRAAAVGHAGKHGLI